MSGVAVLVGGLRIYQALVRPVSGCHCRYWPRCSDYAIGALRAHGATRGSLLAVNRVLRCHPWRVGGYDPVPDARPAVRVEIG